MVSAPSCSLHQPLLTWNAHTVPKQSSARRNMSLWNTLKSQKKAVCFTQTYVAPCQFHEKDFSTFSLSRTTLHAINGCTHYVQKVKLHVLLNSGGNMSKLCAVTDLKYLGLIMGGNSHPRNWKSFLKVKA